jgi:hypothetical protein
VTPAETAQMRGIERWLGQTLPLEVWPEYTDTTVTATPLSSRTSRRPSSTVRHFGPRRRMAIPRASR